MDTSPSDPPRRTPAAASRRRDDGGVPDLALTFGESLRVGDPRTASRQIDLALASGMSSVEIQSRVIAPAMRGIGVRWEHGEIGIAEEHLATALSHHVLAGLYPGLLRKARRRGDTVLVAAAHGEHHILGLRMVADVFEGAGFDVRFLGADVPASSLLAWVQEHRPAIVALGVTMQLGAATIGRQLQELRDFDPSIRLVIGGQGVPPALRDTPGVFYIRDTEQLAAFVERASAGVQGPLPPGLAHGGVHFDRRGEQPYSPSRELDARMAQTAAAVADGARGQARRAFAMEQLAFRDGLTGLWNRRAYDDRYQDLTATGLTRPPAILMVDVDRFKTINDRFGHEVGDRALVGVADCITAGVRPADFAARFGGDEFVVLLPDTTGDVAAAVGERIRALVEHDLTDPAVTVSIGVSAPDHTDRRRAALDADRALYEAKEHGRNQVSFV